MNVAASTLLILYLLLPAVAFRRGYYSGAFSKQYFTERLGELVLRAFLLAVAIHTAAFAVVTSLDVVSADTYAVVVDYLLADAYTDGGRPPAEVWTALALNGALILVGAIGGYLAHRIVRRWRLDRRFKSLRFRNYWHYVLRGEIREFRDARTVFPPSRQDIVYTFIDALVATSQGDVIYDGALVDYELKPDNEIQFLVLTGTRRRGLSADRPSENVSEVSDDPETSHDVDPRYYQIYGDLFVLPGAAIKNYNIRYVSAIDIEATLADAEITLRDADGDTNSAQYYNDRPR